MRARRSDPLNDELTALDELEDEIRRPKKRSWSLIVPLLITMIVMTGSVTIAWYSYTAGIKEGSEGAAPLLKPKGPMKVAPANPGGLAIPHQDKTVFNSIDGRGKEKGVERLLPPPEKPMSIPVKPVPSPAVKPSEAPAGSRVRAADRTGDARAAGKPVPLTPGRARSAQPGPAKTPTPPAASTKPTVSPTVPKAAVTPPASQKTARATPEAKPAKRAVSAGKAFRIQIGSVSSGVQGKKYWDSQSAKHRDLFGKLSLNLQKATIKGKVFYRIQGGPLPNRAAATGMCQKLKTRKIGCIVVPPGRG
jgi:SPOR domain